MPAKGSFVGSAERRVLVSLRLTDLEMEILNNVATQRGVSVSDVIRSRVFGHWEDLEERVAALEARHQNEDEYRLEQKERGHVLQPWE